MVGQLFGPGLIVEVRVACQGRIKNGNVGVDHRFTKLLGEFVVGRAVIGVIAFEVEVSDASVPFEGRDIEVTISLCGGFIEQGRSGFFHRCGEPVFVLLVHHRRVEITHDAPVAVATFHLGPTDMDMD